MSSKIKIPDEFSKYLFLNSEDVLFFDYNSVNKKSIWPSLGFAILMCI